jgi:membrane associated rhomboid family serine protease
MPNLISNLTGTPGTLAILTLIVLVSVAGFKNHNLFLKLILHPNGIFKRKEYYRLFTSDFVHNDLMHLLINVVTGFFVCGELEAFLNTRSGHGTIIFIAIYIASHFAGALTVTWLNRKKFEYSSAGASGSILGCMLSFMILNPNYIAFYLPVVGGLKNVYAGLLLIAGLIVYQRRTGNPMMDHELHFFSALGGIGVTLLLFPDLI